MGDYQKDKGLLNIGEASRQLGISVNTLYAWINQRKITYVKTGRLVKFRQKDIDQWVEKNIVTEEKYD